MTSTELQESDLRQILATFTDGSDYVPAYQAIVDSVETQAKTATIVNRKGRVEAFKAGIATNPRKTVAEINKLFTGLPKLIRKNVKLSENTEPRQLTVGETETLMDEMLSIKKAKDALASREEEIKRLAFGHMTEKFAELGDEYPEHVNGSIDVPSRRYRFSREAAGRKDPVLQENVLRTLVGPAIWARITDRKPTVEVTVNIGKLMAEAAQNPAILEDLRRSLKVGEWKSPRLNVREL